MSGTRSSNCELTGHAAERLRRVFPLLQSLADDGTARDTAGNRRLTFAQYAGLMLVGLFNPTLQSARSLVAASEVKGVKKLIGGHKVSLGSFSEAASVFDPLRLEAIVEELRKQYQEQRFQDNLAAHGKSVQSPSVDLAERLVAIDGSVLTAFSSVIGDTDRLRQWRLHVALQVNSGVASATRLTDEPSQKGRSERDMATSMIESLEAFPKTAAGLYLLDRGYRSAKLFNTIVAAGGDYVARLTRNDGRVVEDESTSPLSEVARHIGVTADEQITYGGSKAIGTDHVVRRITLIPPAGRPSAARQGRPRKDQTGRDELVLATTLLDLPAEDVVALYEQRWQVELFFRFLKHTLGCQQLFSAKTAGVQIQIYCALIASLLLALSCGRSLTKRQWEMACLFMQGWADDEDLMTAFGKPPP